MDVKGGHDSTEGVSARAKGFLSMIEKFQAKVRHSTLSLRQRHLTQVFQLPNMDFPINAMAEGRILVPWEHRKYPNLTEGRSRFSNNVNFI